MTDLKKIVEENLDNTLTDFFIPELGRLERGKIRDNYPRWDERAEIVTDRISAFDVVSPQGIPFKGQYLVELDRNGHGFAKQIGDHDIVKECGANVNLRKACEVYPVEFIIRRQLLGSGWRSYQKNGKVEEKSMEISITYCTK